MKNIWIFEFDRTCDLYLNHEINSYKTRIAYLNRIKIKKMCVVVYLFSEVFKQEDPVQFAFITVMTIIR